ncbi:MAG: CHAT domain-containing protein [Bacteroidota bacterium]
MKNKRPIVLLAMANDPDYSLQLQEEEKKIRGALSNAHDAEFIEFRNVGYAGLEELYNAINRPAIVDKLSIFHFCGHSDGDGIKLQDGDLDKQGLSTLLGSLPNLKLVFLNGCANKDQLEDLHKNGVNTVVATSVKVGDDTAILMAEHFYKALASGRSIVEAFNISSTFLRNYDGDLNVSFRGGFDLSGLDEGAFPWGLYSISKTNEEWRLPDKKPSVLLDIWQQLPYKKTIFATVGFVILWLLPLLFGALNSKTYSGAIWDSFDRPVANVKLTLWENGVAKDSTTSDSNGEFNLPYTLFPLKKDHHLIVQNTFHTEELRLDNSELGVISIPSKITLNGRFIDQKQRPMNYLDLWVDGSNGFAFGINTQKFQTDFDGKFKIPVGVKKGIDSVNLILVTKALGKPSNDTFSIHIKKSLLDGFDNLLVDDLLVELSPRALNERKDIVEVEISGSYLKDDYPVRNKEITLKQFGKILGKKKTTSDGGFSFVFETKERDGLFLHFYNEHLKARDSVSASINEINEINILNPFEIVYYNFKGFAADLVLKGHTADPFYNVIGQSTIVVKSKNPVYDEARSFLDKFGEPPHDYADKEVDSGRDDSTPYSDFFGFLDKPELLRKGYLAYPLGAFEPPNFFVVPDIPAFETVRHKLVPKGYNVSQYVGDDPFLWRYLTFEDLLNYEQDFGVYYQEARPDASFSREGLYVSESRKRIIESLKYITKERFFEDFMIVQSKSMGHFSWGFLTELRQFVVVVAVIQNISDTNIRIGEFQFKTLLDRGLRSPDQTKQMFQEIEVESRKLIPTTLLKPNGKISIPVAISFVYNECQKEVRETDVPKDVNLLIGNHMHHDNPKIKISEKVKIKNTKCKKRYDFGPALQLESVEINNTMVTMRQFDPELIAMVNGFEGGSCPYIFSVDDDGEWLKERLALVNAIGEKYKMTDTVTLNHFTGEIIIAEYEPEITVLDKIELLVEYSDGSTFAFHPEIPALLENDGHEYIIDEDQYLPLSFNELSINFEEIVEANLVITGYYIPLDSPALFLGKE